MSVEQAELIRANARRRLRRVAEARFPRVKRLDAFDLSAVPSLPPATFAALAEGAWIDAGQPVVLLGDSGTGKTHLLIGLGTAAAEAGRRVRYITCAALVNELAEAADERQLSRVVGRYARLDLLCLDEVGYVHLDPKGAELLFQIITAREERASIACASTPHSPNGARPSQIHDWQPRSWTGSPSTPTSSTPAAGPTDYAPAKPDATRKGYPTGKATIMLDIAIDGGDATELAEMLQFLADWLTADHDQLDVSLTRYVGNPAYGADQLQTDLHRFIFLLRGDDGEQLFDDHTGPTGPGPDTERR